MQKHRQRGNERNESIEFDGLRLSDAAQLRHALIAAVLSIAGNHSVLWMLWDALFSWIYVIYFMLFKYGTFHAAVEVLKRFFS